MAVRYKSYTETHSDLFGHQYHFVCECTKCHKSEIITVDGPDLFKYNQGAHAQEAFPELSAAQREMLCVSAFCGPCWDKTFAENDETPLSLEDKS